MSNLEDFILLHEAEWTCRMHGIIWGPYKQAYVKKADEGKTMIGVYNENGECVGRFEDTGEPDGELGPEWPHCEEGLGEGGA